MFSRFGTVQEYERQTDGRTNRQICYASLGKNVPRPAQHIIMSLLCRFNLMLQMYSTVWWFLTWLALAGHMIDRIQFRIAVTVYHCLHGTAPEYLSELLIPASTRSSRYCLRSSDSNQLVVPPVKLSTYGRRAFSVSGPVVWNSLPDYIKRPHIIPWFVQALSQNLPFCMLLINSRRPSALETLWLYALYKFFIALYWRRIITNISFFLFLEYHNVKAVKYETDYSNVRLTVGTFTVATVLQFDDVIFLHVTL